MKRKSKTMTNYERGNTLYIQYFYLFQKYKAVLISTSCENVHNSCIFY